MKIIVSHHNVDTQCVKGVALLHFLMKEKVLFGPYLNTRGKI